MCILSDYVTFSDNLGIITKPNLTRQIYTVGVFDFYCNYCILAGQISSTIWYIIAAFYYSCRYGFNSCGHADAAERLKLWQSKSMSIHYMILKVYVSYYT